MAGVKYEEMYFVISPARLEPFPPRIGVPPETFWSAGPPVLWPIECRSTLGRDWSWLQRPLSVVTKEPLFAAPISTSVTTNSGVLGDHKIGEIGVTRGSFVRPEYEHGAALLGAVRTMLLAGFNVN